MPKQVHRTSAAEYSAFAYRSVAALAIFIFLWLAATMPTNAWLARGILLLAWAIPVGLVFILAQMVVYRVVLDEAGISVRTLTLTQQLHHFRARWEEITLGETKEAQFPYHRMEGVLFASPGRVTLIGEAVIDRVQERVGQIQIQEKQSPVGQAHIEGAEKFEAHAGLVLPLLWVVGLLLFLVTLSESGAPLGLILLGPALMLPATVRFISQFVRADGPLGWIQSVSTGLSVIALLSIGLGFMAFAFFGLASEARTLTERLSGLLNDELFRAGLTLVGVSGGWQLFAWWRRVRGADQQTEPLIQENKIVPNEGIIKIVRDGADGEKIVDPSPSITPPEDARRGLVEKFKLIVRVLGGGPLLLGIALFFLAVVFHSPFLLRAAGVSAAIGVVILAAGSGILQMTGTVVDLLSRIDWLRRQRH